MASNMTYLDESPLPADKYNALPHIDDNKTVEANHEAGRNQLLALILSKKLQRIFSIHLVHKHFDLPQNRVMVYEMIKGSKDYPDFQISSPRIPSTCENLHGVYFRADTGGRMVAYEYTTDPLVDISGYNEFFRQFSNLVMELGLQDVYALTLKYVEGPPLLHEFEMPDLGSTVLVPDASWIPGAASSVSTDWGFSTISGDFNNAAVLTRCTETRSGRHHEVTKYEPDDSNTNDVSGGGIMTLTRCTETRSGKHHERPKRHLEEAVKNAAVLTRCTETRSGRHHEVTKYEPDDSNTNDVSGGGIMTLTRCTETRSGKHHERPKRHLEDMEKSGSEALMINGELLLPGSAVFSVVSHARQLISAF